VESSWAELLEAPPIGGFQAPPEAPPPPRTVQASPEVRLEDFQAREDDVQMSLEAVELSPDEVQATPVDTSEARQKAQADLIREMNEALRRAGAAPAEEWLADDAPAPPAVAPAPASAAVEEVPELFLAEEDVAVPGPPLAIEPTLTPEVLAPEMQAIEAPVAATEPPLPRAAAQAPVDADLWNILQSDGSDADLRSSFEKALESVDAQLEALVGALPSEADLPEATIEAFESDNPFGTVQSSIGDGGEEGWDDYPLSEEDELAGDPSDPAEAARLRRKRLMRRAMENLGAFQPRPTPTTTGAVPVDPGAPPAHVGAGSPGTPDEHQLAALIEKRFEEVKSGVDYFALLGLPRTAKKDNVKAAFLNLAKVFHPDRLPSSLAALAPKMTAVFEAVREAYEALFDDARRKNYLQELELKAKALAAQPNTPGESAEESYKKAEALFRKRDFAVAESLYAHAHELKPSATYLAARAWAIYMDPNRKGELATAKQLMMDALRLDSRNDRAHYQLGVIARVDGDMDRAERHFREAVSSNPKHLEAAQELRLLEMRKKNQRKPTKP
jgi:curved DNA-binding protein CbpA